jgi:lipoate-protein ligase A
MGVDEALLASAAAGGPATLRLYRWSGPWLSLGYGQRLDAERARRCAGAGVGVVRRASGGRAVLHGQDLTYAVAAPAAWLPAGIEASHARLAGALGEALGRLGLAVEAAGAGAGAAPDFDCFARPAAHELCAAGRKLVGSAQRRVAGALLEHGSLRLAPDPPAARAAAGLASEQAVSLRELGVGPPLVELCARLAEAFAAALCARFEPGVLSPSEVASAERRELEPPSPPLSATPGESQGGFRHAR